MHWEGKEKQCSNSVVNNYTRHEKPFISKTAVSSEKQLSSDKQTAQTVCVCVCVGNEELTIIIQSTKQVKMKILLGSLSMD
jgi:hypothetical protein